jgi:hypothetical protein
MLVVIGTDCIYIGSLKFNYHTITTMTVPTNIYIDITKNKVRKYKYYTTIVF